jgi:release factor glutamine methyltransferase
VKSIFKKTEIIAWFNQELSDVLEEGERQEILLRLLENHAIDRLDWALAQEVELDAEVWEGNIQDLKKHKPIQYILGYEYFAGEKFEVNANVLIPRPETEELVNWVVTEHKDNDNLSILEIGTGSGCIAVSLSKALPQAEILATDISHAALAVAKKNAQRLSAAVQFLKDDILNSNLSENRYDIIVSNPPYIPLDEAAKIHERVKDFEPKLALFSEEKKPLQFYEAIFKFSEPSLITGGVLYFEVHEEYAQEVLHLAVKKGCVAKIKNDFYGKERMLRIKKASH